MTGKIIAAVVALLLIAGGAYWYFGMRENSPEPATNTEEQQQAAPQVQAQDAVVGTGKEAIPGSQIAVHYVGMLQDGTVFDSSANNNNQPLTFTLGAPGIIPGFQIGVKGMKEGGERRIQIPPELGYGTADVHQNPSDPNSPVVIPANSTIIFDIKLVSVTSSATTTPSQ